MISASPALLQLLEKKAKYFRSIAEIICRLGARLDGWPEGMLDDFEQATRHWPGVRVHIERFVPPALPADPNGRPYTLARSRSKLEMRVEPG